MSKFDNGLNVCGSSRKSVENSVDISALLHGDDTKLILLINPDEEGLLLVVEDTSAVGPVAVKTSDFEETVSFLEEEVISNELILFFLGERVQRVESSSEVAFESLASFDNLSDDFVSLLVRDAWCEWVSFEVTTNANTS